MELEVKLKEASHRIIDLWYDESDNTVKGKIELLDTPNGKLAKSIVDQVSQYIPFSSQYFITKLQKVSFPLLGLPFITTTVLFCISFYTFICKFICFFITLYTIMTFYFFKMKIRLFKNNNKFFP